MDVPKYPAFNIVNTTANVKMPSGLKLDVSVAMLVTEIDGVVRYTFTSVGSFDPKTRTTADFHDLIIEPMIERVERGLEIDRDRNAE